MPSLEEVSRRCLAVRHVPIEVSADIVCSHVTRHLRNGRIVDKQKVQEIESRNFKRLILLCSAEEDVDHICQEIKCEEVQIGDRCVVVKYQKAVACELPDRWEDFEIPEDMNPQLCADFTRVRPKPSLKAHQKGRMFAAPRYPETQHQPFEVGGKRWRQNQQQDPGPSPLYSRGITEGQNVDHSPEVEAPTGKYISEWDCVSESVDEGTAESAEESKMTQGKPTQIVVSNLPSSIDVEYLEMFFENKKKYGGGTVVHIDLDEENATAIVEFQESGAVDIVLNKCPIMMMRQEVEVSVFKPQPLAPLCTIEITGPCSVVCEDQLERLEMYFDSEKRSGGGDVVECRFDSENSMVLVTFENEEVAERVVERGNHVIKNKNLRVKLHTPTKQAKQSGKTDKAPQVAPKTVKAKGIDELASGDTVKLPLENTTHSVGGKIKKISSDGEDKDVFYENKQENEPPQLEDQGAEKPEMQGIEEKPTKIVVNNLPSTAHEEYLEMFFENKRKFGGGPVFNVDFDEENATAVVEFEEPEAVDIILNKCPIRMMGQEVEVIVYKPEPHVPLCTVEVTGPRSVVCEAQLDTLEMYFENEKRSGGGDIVGCKFDSENSMVLLTFESEEVAERVEERASHVVMANKLMVKLHIPTKQSNKSTKTKEEKEDEPPKTIKVKGVDKSSARDTVEFYFENSRRSGGGEIERIYSDEEDDDVIYITFKNTHDAENVVKKGHHKVEGNELSVSLYTPLEQPSSYENKILIKGLKSTTTQGCLFNFIEAKTGYIPNTMDYHAEQEDIVMVTFIDKPDFQKLEKAFGKSKLEGALLKVYPVPISNCITVANLASEVTKDTVEFYFENTRKSGGGQVEKVVMNEDDTYLVYFADYTLVEAVLDRTHKLGGQKLDVKRYQECLCRPEGEIAERLLRLPGNIVLKDVDSQKIKFIKQSNVNRSAIEAQLESCFTKITWPTETGHVLLVCTLTKEVKDCFKLVKQWKDTAAQNFNDFMKNIFLKRVPVLQEIWFKVMEDLQSVMIDNTEAVAIFVDKKESAITVVGNKHVAESLATTIDEITKKAKEEIERENIKIVFTGLKLIETKMLVADKFPTEMEKVFPDLKVKINQNKNEIVFEGPFGQVRDAKSKMYEIKSKFAKASIDKISDLAAGLFLFKQTEEHVVKKLKASHLTAVWDIKDGSLMVYSTSDKQIQHCLSIIHGSVIENTILLKKASRTVVNSGSWQAKVDELHGHCAGKCHIRVPEDANKVQICATDDITNDIVDSLKTFLRLNTVIEMKVPCTKNVHRLIEKHHKTELTGIAKNLQHLHVQIVSIPMYGGFEIHGTEDGIQEARTRLVTLLQRVKQREHTLNKPGLAEHMQTSKGKDNLNTIESTIACVVSVKSDDDDEENYEDPYDTVPMDSGVSENIRIKGLKIIGFCKAYDCRNIYTGEGDMTQLTVNMLVNSADDKLSLTRGLGKALVEKGGKEIQKECSDYINSEGRLDDADAFVSTAGKLKADSIVHVREPVRKGSMYKEDDTLAEAVFISLQQASARNFSSIAIPAVSFGTYGYPIQKATSTIVKAVKNFFREVQDSTVTDIYLCDMKLNTVEAFNEALSREFGSSNFQKFVLEQNEKSLPTPRKLKNISYYWQGSKDTDDDQRPPKKRPQKQTDPHKVTFIFLALSDDIINKALAKLEACLQKEVHSKNFDDSIIAKMDDIQLTEVRAIAQQCHLEMQLESERGHIQISGMTANVLAASDKIHRLMRDAVALEQHKNSAALVSNLVQWSYIEVGETGQTVQPYNKDLNYKIETAYLNKAKDRVFRAGEVEYVLNFNRMEEYAKDNPGDVVAVIRRDFVKQGAFEPPAQWQEMTGNLSVVVLQSTDQEYQGVAQQFLVSSGPGFNVVKVERVQNKILWAQYQAKKKQLDDQNPANTTNERLLWHGTSLETVDNINAHGFNRSYCGTNATIYGDGVYFAVSAQFSCQNRYSRPDSAGVKRMYYCYVLTGEYTQGKQGMRVPPNKGGAGSTALYDSVVDRPTGPGMYIIFDDTQAYPKYIVSFKQQ